MTEKDIKFNCDGCGLCCRNVDALYNQPKGENEKLDKLIEEFPYTHDNGVCEKLDTVTNKCTVYEDRPLICQVVKLYHHLEPPITMEHWLQGNYDGCRYLKDNNKID